MKTISVFYQTSEVSIKIGDDIVREELNRLKTFSSVIITDHHIASLYSYLLKDFLVIIVPKSEDAKTLSTYHSVIQQLLALEIHKDGILIALGGGSISDLTGFVASTYKRGIKYVAIPTTLLAQVDASIGGKNGLNIDNTKNQIGTIYQPCEIIIDSIFLKTLNQRDYHLGLSEIIKYALLFDYQMFVSIENGEDNLNEMITRCVMLKVNITKEDEFDEGVRSVLNYGHTIGHALESLSSFQLNHGEAIAWGMVHETSDPVIKARLVSLFNKYNLLPDHTIGFDQVLSIIQSDKKIMQGKMLLAKVHEIGKYTIICQSTTDFIKEVANE